MKIIISGAGVKLSNQKALDRILKKRNTRCLLDDEKCEVDDFAELTDGGQYTEGPTLESQSTGPPYHFEIAFSFSFSSCFIYSSSRYEVSRYADTQ